MRLRECQRYCRANPGDAYAHARLLRHLLAAETIKPTSIILAAYLGHPSCMLLVNNEIVKPSGIIRYGHLVKNIEIKDYILNLQNWGFLIVYLAAAAMLRLAIKEIKIPADIAVLNENVELINTLVRSPNVENRKAVLARREKYLYSRDIPNTKNQRMVNQIHSMVALIGSASNCIENVYSLSINFDDEDVKEAIRKEIYPFILGENL